MPIHLSSPTTLKKQLATEAGRLFERLNGIASGFRSAAIAVVADAGMGKTHTVKQVLSAIPCTRVLIPISEPWHWLHTRLPATTKPLPVWAEQVFKQLKEQQNLSEKSVAQAVLTYLTALSPVLVHLEDAHEASPAQLALWVTVAQMLGKSKGIGLIITSRLPLSAAFQEFSLQALDQKAATALLNNTAVYPLPADAITWIYQRSLGNPLFTLEFFQHALRQGFLWQVQKQWFWQEPIQTQTIPKDLEAIIIERLEHISEATSSPNSLQKILLTLAFLPELPVLRDTIFETWTTEEQDVYNLELIGTGIWINNGFVHPLYPEVLRSKIWIPERISVARALIAPTLVYAPELMDRLVMAACLEPEEAFEVWQQVVGIAKAKGNNLLAGRAMAQAMEQAPAEQKAQLASSAGALLKTYDRHEWFRLCEIAFQLEPQNQLYVRHRVLTLTHVLRYNEADELLNNSVHLATRDALWLAAALQVQTLRGDYAKVLQIWLEHADLQKDVNPAIIWAVAWAYIQLSEFKSANTLIDQTLEQPVDLITQLQLKNVKGLGYRTAGNLIESLTVYTEALQGLTPEQIESRLVDPQIGLLTFNRGLVLQDLSRKHEATTDIRAALALLTKMGNTTDLPLHQAGLAASILYDKQFEEAERLLLEARELLKNTNDWRSLRSVELQLSHQYMEWRPPLAEILVVKHARAALAYLRRIGGAPEVAKDLISIAWAEAVYGQANVALELIEEQIQIATQLDLAVPLARGNWIKARARFSLGFKAQAQTEMLKALEQLQELETPVTFERWGLEYDYLFELEKSAKARIQRLEQIGDEALLALHVAKNFFPQLFDLPKQTTQTSLAKLEVLGEMRYATQTISKRLKKARELLALLLEARLMGRVVVTQLEMIDALYPEENEEAASSAIRQLIYRLRKSLGSEIVQHTTLGYCLGVRTDAEDFLETLDTTIWRGVYLEDEICLNPSVQEALSEALTRAITQNLPVNPIEATRASRILLNMNPFERPALRLHLQALEASLDSSLNSFYQVQQEQYQKIGEALPSTWQEFILLPE